MKKTLFALYMIVILFLLASNSFSQMALEWDAYTDPDAAGLRLLQSTDQENWSVAVDNISTSDTSVAVPTPQSENVRVYYVLVAFDGEGEISGPSNMVSYYWTTGGGGQEGLNTPNSIRFIDCNNPRDAGEQQICTDLGLSGN